MTRSLLLVFASILFPSCGAVSVLLFGSACGTTSQGASGDAAPADVAADITTGPETEASADSGAPIDAAPDGTAPDATLSSDAPPESDGAASEAASLDAGSGNGCASVTSTPIVVATDIAADTSWTCDHLYLVQGTIKVLSPATLTIAPGTTVLMSNDATNDGNLIVAPGATLDAVGTRDLPIVFTSSALGRGAAPKAGDWGCLALVGYAPGNWGTAPDGGAQMSASPDDANSFPGNSFPFIAGSDDPTHDTDSSGTLAYVRLEYGGNVRNALGSAVHEMLGVYGAGSGTLLDHVDMRQASFGCLFAQGGSFRAHHLLCQYGGESGGFDFSRGNHSRAQFLLAQENPNLSSEGVGYKGPFDVNQLAPLTAPTLYNVTACGTNGGIDMKDPYAFFMRRAPSGVLANFIGTGYFAGLAMTGGAPQPSGGNLVAKTQVRSSTLFGNFDPFADGGTNIVDPRESTSDTNLVAWFGNAAWLNSSTPPSSGIVDCYDANNLLAAPSSAISQNAETPPNDGFFDPTATYEGAFRDSTDDWATGNWVRWSDH
jgi:hypothetical protein